MNLRIDQYLEDCGGSVCDLVDAQNHVIAKCGGIEDAQEIIRRVNAHEALVAALTDLLGVAQASIVNARNRNEHSQIIKGLELREASARAALALTKKGE